jgi:hypothetical protein
MRARACPGPSGRMTAEALQKRLDALPANHPSPRFLEGQGRGPDQPGDSAGEVSGDKKQARPADLAVERYGKGSIDQRARTFLPSERASAEALALRGADVTAFAEDHSLRERQPDAIVDGRVTEFKSLRPGATDATGIGTGSASRTQPGMKNTSLP